MTKDEILALQPGRELDNLIAEKVMGLTGYDFDDTHWYCSTCKAWVHPAQVTFHEVHERCQTPVVADWCDEEGNVMPNYSTDISAAWEVVEKMQEKKLVRLHANEGEYICKIGGDLMCYKSNGNSMPEAICKAALLAVMEELPQATGTTEQLSHEVTEAVSGFSDQIKE